jgi:hypothetical protein
MTLSPQNSLVINSQTENPLLSKAQQRFNELIKKIDEQKQLLAQWQHAQQQCQQLITGDYYKLWDSYINYRVELVYLLDAAYSNKRLKGNEKLKLSQLIIALCVNLIEQHGKDELKSVYNHYNETDFDSSLDTNDADLLVDYADNNTESFDDYARAKEDYHQQRKQKHQTKKQAANELKHKQSEQESNKAIQSVFRQLAAAIHPDRELDELERERKTKLMQQANIAYAKKDLLQLLALQLEIEQLKPNQLNSIAQERLQHFNKVLQQQYKDLKQQTTQLEEDFKAQLSLKPFAKLSPKQAIKSLKEEVKNLQFNITLLQRDIKTIQDTDYLKAWLRAY